MNRYIALLTQPKVSLTVLFLGLALIIAAPAGIILGASTDTEDKSARPSPPALDDSSVVIHEGIDAPATPPKEMILVDKSGLIRVPVWDDRAVPEAEKSAHPFEVAFR